MYYDILMIKWVCSNLKTVIESFPTSTVSPSLWSTLTPNTTAGNKTPQNTNCDSGNFSSNN